MSTATRPLALLLAALLPVGCASVPMPVGPSFTVMPAPGKPLDLFQDEDLACRRWAQRQVGMSPQAAADQSAAAGAVVGSTAGAILGAAIGSASGHAGEGALIGAGSGFLLGATSAYAESSGYAWEAQYTFDAAYQQCMYANGNILPGMTHRDWRWVPPPPGADSPAPPSGPQRYPPPPPPQKP
jgi:hypothetical protein